LSEVDTACYLANELGGNRVQAHEAESEQLAERKGQMFWTNQIPKAIEANQFELYYQTISPMNNSNQLHIELIRFRNEQDEIISPAVFLLAAERYHLSSSIDKWVVDRAFSMLSKMKKDAPIIGQCSINLSGTSMGNTDFIQFLLKKTYELKNSTQSYLF
jgi:EAL domain-containing protein (putative c-di-GMP-specific phosphodiesterase class I)